MTIRTAQAYQALCDGCDWAGEWHIGVNREMDAVKELDERHYKRRGYCPEMDTLIVELTGPATGDRFSGPADHGL